MRSLQVKRYTTTEIIEEIKRLLQCLVAQEYNELNQQQAKAIGEFARRADALLATLKSLEKIDESYKTTDKARS